MDQIMKPLLKNTAGCMADAEMIQTALPKAIRNKELDVFYQPQLNVPSGTSTHFEALVRWKHARFGFISPATFIPVAEEQGLIEDLTDFVLNRVADDLRDWQNAGMLVESVSVNVSAKSLANPLSAVRLLGALNDIVAFAPYIVLELTETALVENVDLARLYMDEFKRLGSKIALDDFGSGYASMRYLLEFPVDIVKIDRCFVSTLHASAKSQVIVKSIMALGEMLGLKVITEGVETADEFELLVSLGCKDIQGFYFSKPLPKERITKNLAPDGDWIKTIIV